MKATIEVSREEAARIVAEYYRTQITAENIEVQITVDPLPKLFNSVALANANKIWLIKFARDFAARFEGHPKTDKGYVSLLESKIATEEYIKLNCKNP